MSELPIKFWTTKGKWGCFSNFSKHPISFGGYIYPTSEHLYQALKFKDSESRRLVREAKTPKDAKRVAYSLPNLRTNWDKFKYAIMCIILELKFEQHMDVRLALHRSGIREIQEDSPYDFTWGIGKDGSGKNLLGKAWMEVRSRIIDPNKKYEEELLQRAEDRVKNLFKIEQRLREKI